MFTNTFSKGHSNQRCINKLINIQGYMYFSNWTKSRESKMGDSVLRICEIRCQMKLGLN